MVLGFYVGTFVDSDLGHVLLRYGKAPFHAAMARAYFDRYSLVLGLLVTLLVAQAAWGNPIVQVIAFKAAHESLLCFLFYPLVRVIM